MSELYDEDGKIRRYLPSNCLDTVVDSLPKCTISKKTLRLIFKQQVTQRTDAWLEKRAGILTASDCASAIDQNKYCTRQELILRKAGLSKNVFPSGASMPVAIKHGIDHEDEAADIYMLQNPHLAPFFEFGLMMHDKHTFLGASPDRITKDGILIEIKVLPGF